jgi:prefoldin beta subunit
LKRDLFVLPADVRFFISLGLRLKKLNQIKMEANKKIQEMQFLEQNLQNLLLQKQAFQMELSETASALKEIENSGDEVFKIIGQLMIKTNKSKMKQELLEKEKILDLRTKSIEKQEKYLIEQLDGIRDKIMNASK